MSPRPIFLRKEPRINLDPVLALAIGLIAGALLGLFGV